MMRILKLSGFSLFFPLFFVIISKPHSESANTVWLFGLCAVHIVQFHMSHPSSSSQGSSANINIFLVSNVPEFDVSAFCFLFIWAFKLSCLETGAESPLKCTLCQQKCSLMEVSGET